MSDGSIELLYFSAAILFITTISSYANKKFGIFSASIVTLISIMLTFGIATIGGNFLFGGFMLFPGLAWFGFFTGQFFYKKNFE